MGHTTNFAFIPDTSLYNTGLPLDLASQPALETSRSYSDFFGNFGRIGVFFTELAAVAASLFSLDNTGTLLSYALYIKTLVMFRFINVFYGEILENMMQGLGKKIEIESNQEHNSKIRNSIGNKAKFDTYEKPITTIQHYYFKTIVYLTSWVFKIGFLIFLKISKIKKVGKVMFYVVLVH